MITWIEDLGSIGLVKDSPGSVIPHNAWTEAVNVRFRDGAIERIDGESVFTIPSEQAYSLFSVLSEAQTFWVYCSLRRATAVTENGETHADITRQADGVEILYEASPTSLWVGTVFSGHLIITNGIDTPQMWATINHMNTLLVDLPGFPSDIRCRFIRAYKDYLVAAYVTETSEGEANPFLIRWSVSADVGAVPASWDYTDPSLDSGRIELPGDDDPIIWLENLGDSLLIYRRKSTWAMDFIGGPFVMKMSRKFPFGALARNCVASYLDNHFVLGDGYIVVHDGVSTKEPLNKKLVKWLFNRISPTHSSRCWVAVNPLHKEIWTAFPIEGAEYPTTAIIWNWEYDTAYIRDLPDASGYALGKISRNTNLVDDGSFDSAIGTFNENERTFNKIDDQMNAALGQSLLICAPGLLTVGGEIGAESKILNVTSGAMKFGDIPYTSTLTHEALLSDLDKVKQIQGVYLSVESPTPAEFLISLGSRETPSDPVSYLPGKMFISGQSRKVDQRISGKTIDLHVVSSTPAPWKITKIGLDIAQAGGR